MTDVTQALAAANAADDALVAHLDACERCADTVAMLTDAGMLVSRATLAGYAPTPLPSADLDRTWARILRYATACQTFTRLSDRSKLAWQDLERADQ